MAAPKFAKVKKVNHVGTTSVEIIATYEEGAFVAGKFLIIDTGLTLSDGKAHKRAYSLVKVNVDTKEFTLMIKKLKDTAGADYMHSLKEGDTLTFSGPWGKFYDQGGDATVTLIATDTGLTACHGYEESIQGQKLIDFYWFRESDTYFCEGVDFSKSSLQTYDLSPVGTEGRAASCWGAIEESLSLKQPQKVCLAGDGDVLLPIKDKLLAMGYEDDNVQIEMFFNNPTKKST